MRLLFILLLSSLFSLLSFSVASANYSLRLVSDLIANSLPSSTSTTHTITFKTPSDLPLGSKIVIKPDGAAFDFPAGMDFTDIDFATAATTTGPFTDRPLAAAAAPAADGVTVVTGLGGSFTITLGDSASGAIASTSILRIKVGTNATVGAAGSRNITNPTNPNSYHIRIDTYTAGDVPIDDGTAMVAIVTPTVIGPVDTSDTVAPVRSGGMPAGLLPGSTVAVQLALYTDKTAFCRYSTTASTSYDMMTGILTASTNYLLHYGTISGLTPQTSYIYYVRCQNTNGGAENNDDYAITFQIGAVPNPGATAGGGGSSSGGGASGPSGGGGGGGGLFLQGGDVTLDGRSIPGATLVVLRDGTIVTETPLSSDGFITTKYTALERGTYTFSIYAKDPQGKKTATYSSTIFLIGRTNNIIAPIYLSPTISAPTTVALGNDIALSGYAIPGTVVSIILNTQGNPLSGKIVTATTTSSGEGKWSALIPTSRLTKGTYELKAQSVLSTKDASNFSPLHYVGVGENPNPNFGMRADLNGDKKVNLVDFSILLYHWKSADATADINQDGTVNLTDFSIMLSNWTG